MDTRNAPKQPTGNILPDELNASMADNAVDPRVREYLNRCIAFHSFPYPVSSSGPSWSIMPSNCWGQVLMRNSMRSARRTSALPMLSR